MKKIFLSVLCYVLLLCHSSPASDFRFSPRLNKAHLIQWRAWGQEIFDEAQKKNKLILLSLSAIWCHWCHVMDETTYSDPEIISLINNNFIPVRVDADMRPDIDTLYNQGGWPSTAILTPQGEVINGGNYIPPEEMLGRLKRTAALFSGNRNAVLERIEEIRAMKELRSIGQEGYTGVPDKIDLDYIVQILKDSFDEKNGGFGRSQKFPSPDSIDFLLSVYAKNKDEGIKKIVTLTLDHMAQGEIFDKVEGGFFRYATKTDWSQPHYEKMLEVNAQLIRSYADASLVLGRKDYIGVVRKSIQFVMSNLYDDEDGAFFGSQDADDVYYKRRDRKGMKAPFVDKTTYTDSSSLMISALIASYGATSDKQYLGMAIKGADYLLAKLYSSSDGVCHYFSDGVPHLTGLLSDNALMGSALLDLYNATGEKRYLNAAKEIGKLTIGQFYDAANKRFRSTLETSLSKPVTAGPLSVLNENLANYRAIRFLGRLEFTGEVKRLKGVRDVVVATISGEYQRFAPQAGAYGNAAIWIAGEPFQIIILTDGKGARKYLSVINSVYVPEKVVRVLSLSEDAREIAKLKYTLKESVYLCAGKRCSAPIAKTEHLKEELIRFIEKKN
jgi:uncharacterized protein YyaL (SSP411 family)